MPKIVSTALSFPEHYYSQKELLEAMRSLWSDRPASLSRLEQFYENVEVRGRYLALPLQEYVQESSFGERNDAWIQVAQDLGEEVLCDLCQAANLSLTDISMLAFTTVTGIAVPSIDARLMNRLSFSPHMKRMPLFGLGCMGGAAGVARVADYLEGHPQEAAVLLSVELCSLTIQRDDLSVANMISSGLFGDGSAGVMLVGDEHPLAGSARPSILSSQSVFFPQTEHVMGWEVSESGFKIVLSSDVVPVTETQLRPALEAFLASYSLSIKDIKHWIAHPGGPKVIQALEESLDLAPGALQRSRESLAEYGNLSSASVLAVLQSTLHEQNLQPGDYGVLLAMGPAFSAEAVLLQW